MKKTSEILRKHNIKVTPQRLCVYTALSCVDSHMSVEEVYRQVKKDVPAISLATVYSILENFSDKGLASEIRIDFGRSLYEAHKGAHHHFFCRKCQEIFDVCVDSPCSVLKNKNADGHLIEDFQGYFYGICKKCKTKNSKS